MACRTGLNAIFRTRWSMRSEICSIGSVGDAAHLANNISAPRYARSTINWTREIKVPETRYTLELANEIYRRMSEGEPLRQICRDQVCHRSQPFDSGPVTIDPGLQRSMTKRAASRLSAGQTGVGAQISCWAWVGSYRCLSGDALRHRHAEPGHPVEHRAGDPGLGLLAGQSPGAEATTDDGLVPEHGGFPERAPAVADRLLPAQAAHVPDHPDVLVALTGRGVSGRARHGRGAGRDDHSGATHEKLEVERKCKAQQL